MIRTVRDMAVGFFISAFEFPPVPWSIVSHFKLLDFSFRPHYCNIDSSDVSMTMARFILFIRPSSSIRIAIRFSIRSLVANSSQIVCKPASVCINSPPRLEQDCKNGQIDKPKGDCRIKSLWVRLEAVCVREDGLCHAKLWI